MGDKSAPQFVVIEPITLAEDVKKQLKQLRKAEAYEPEFVQLQANLLSLQKVHHPEAKLLWKEYVTACSEKDPEFFKTGEPDDNPFFDETKVTLEME